MATGTLKDRTLTYSDNMFIIKGDQSFRLPHFYGFQYNPRKKIWFTKSRESASRLHKYADENVKKILELKEFKIEEPTGLVPKMPKGLTLMEHQEKEAIPFALSRKKSYLGLEPGLGKTICAAVVARTLKMPTVYVTPPFLTENIVAEFSKWAPELSVRVFKTKDLLKPYKNVGMLIIPDTLIARDGLRRYVRRHLQNLPGLLIVDEAHRFKNLTAKRTGALLTDDARGSIVSVFKNGRQIYMSGTPMPNRPIELFPILHKVVPELINYMGRYAYARRYCQGHMGQWGWDESGASNLVELKSKIVGTFMLRLRKDILNLPPKVEEIFVISKNMSPSLSKMNKGLGEKYKDVADIIKKQIAKKSGKDPHELHVMNYRRMLGVEKAPIAAELIESIMDSSDECVIVYAYHKEVIDILVKKLVEFYPVVITGETPMSERQARVKEFQESTKKRLIIGNYVAMGVGFTITKASRVIFVEFSWVPGDNVQAADRAHRIGQDKTVLVQYMVYRSSIDKAVVESLLSKQRAINYL